jgi:hypothetical protein
MRSFGIIWGCVMSEVIDRRVFELDVPVNNLEAIAQLMLHLSASQHLEKDEQIAIGWLAGTVHQEVKQMRKILDG